MLPRIILFLLRYERRSSLIVNQDTVTYVLIDVFKRLAAVGQNGQTKQRRKFAKVAILSFGAGRSVAYGKNGIP